MKKIFKYLMITLAILVWSNAQGDSTKTVGPYVLQIDDEFKVPTQEYVVFVSSGGRVDLAWHYGPAFKDKICLVKFAASAAFEILLPYCKERYFLPRSQLQFHDVHIIIPPFQLVPIAINQWGAEEIATQLKVDNAKMLDHMQASGFPMSRLWLEKALRENYFIQGSGLSHLEPWILPVNQCHHCPDWVKMIQ